MQFTKLFALSAGLIATAIAATVPEDQLNARAADVLEIRDDAAVGCVQIKNGLGCPPGRPKNCKDFANGNHHCCKSITSCPA